MAGTYLVAAGGTGGHLFPAEALAHELGRRGHAVELVTDERAQRLRTKSAARRVHVVSSATFGSRSPSAVAATTARLGRGFLSALRIVRRTNPLAVIGFGGYPTLPPLFAARVLGRPTIVHEANAVAGRANRLLARFAQVATSFPDVKGFEDVRRPPVQTGLPVRPSVLEAAQRGYPAPDPDGDMRLLVFGGSQGARVFAERMTAACAAMPAGLRGRISITQQCRAEDLDDVRAAYADLGVTADLAIFFTDLPERIAAAHLVISRAGASTVAELATIGRPAILVPLPHALDQDQASNASALAGLGGGWRIDQADLTPERLASEIAALSLEPARLSRAAEAARQLARPDAAARLADLVEAVSQPRSAEKAVAGALLA